MASFTVHVPHDTDAISRADRTHFVRDGFSVWAFLFGPLYLLRYRAWTAAAVWVIVVLGGAWLCAFIHLPEIGRAVLLLLIAWLTGLEANSLRRFTLHSRGFDIVDVVEGSRAESERAFFRNLAVRDTVPPPRAGLRAALDERVIGYLDDGPPA